MCWGRLKDCKIVFFQPLNTAPSSFFPCWLFHIDIYHESYRNTYYYYKKKKRERQCSCFSIFVKKIHYFLFYFSGIVLTFFAMGCVMHGIISWHFKRSGIHRTGQNITVPTFIITHTEDLSRILERKGTFNCPSTHSFDDQTITSLQTPGRNTLVLSSCPLWPGHRLLKQF